MLAIPQLRDLHRNPARLACSICVLFSPYQFMMHSPFNLPIVPSLFSHFVGFVQTAVQFRKILQYERKLLYTDLSPDDHKSV
jgi:hypothetical protein